LGAGLFVLPSSIVRDRVGGDRMARMLSLIMMVFMIVPILAPTIGQGLMLLGDWRLVPASMALACALVAGWVWWRLPETLPADRRQPIDPRTIAGN
ncbi:multidrug effflux MFS transporter, partial [Staphylococcus aureus]|uniref:multidrug effflux MFS transporter n=1 Tax=Staphylococcus aureus TaxID=1280 RepID=UPI0013EE4B1A